MTTVATAHPAPMLHESFIELPARERARSLLDAGTFRELLGPFDKIESPWLPLQGIVCQADDGCVIARGTIDGEPAVVAAIESRVPGRQHRRSVRQQDRRRARPGACATANAARSCALSCCSKPAASGSRKPISVSR